MSVVIKEVKCAHALTRGSFNGELSINPYIGCSHACAYCYARFMKRFTTHEGDWGSFIDIKTNIAELLAEEAGKLKSKDKVIYIGTATDPYQPIEKFYKLTRKILEILGGIENKVRIMTKSHLVLRDLDIIKNNTNISVNITVNNLNEKWTMLTEPKASSLNKRLDAIKKLSDNGVDVCMMMGPWWPYVSDAEKLIPLAKHLGVKSLFTESVNTSRDNFNEVERILEKFYPKLAPKMKNVLFNKEACDKFYESEEERMKEIAAQNSLPISFKFKRD